MSSRFDVDLFVIGGGSGGVRAARVAAEHGAKVAIAEESRWGGTCVVRGCVPKKLMVYASEVSRSLDDARGQGWTIAHDVKFDWPTFLALKDQEIARLTSAYRTRLEKAGVRVIEGHARLADAHTIEVGGERVTAANILVATGGRPRIPEDRPPTGSHRYVTSDEVFHLPSLPKRIGILGAGYIGIEFAHIFRGFGCDVTLVHRGEHVLRGFDPEVAREVEGGIARHGIKLVLGDHIDFEVDLAMAAIGRVPVTAGIGLVEAGVVLDGRGAVLVDEWSRTNVPHIYSVGDATARVQLTPVAIREGHALADTLFGGKPTPVRLELIPTAVFAQPPLASVGLSEPAAIAAGHDVQIFRARFRPMRYALSKREEYVLMKVVVSRANDAVLGVHMVGPDAPEIIQTAAIALTMGAKKADLDRTFALHPTTAEELVLLR
jgi:glutathione reductase (NADPH)